MTAPTSPGPQTRRLWRLASKTMAALMAGLVALAGPATATAQQATPGLPSVPVPYTKLRPKAAPRPAPRPAAAPAALTPPPVLSGALPLATSGPPGARLQPGQPLPSADVAAFVDGVVAEAMAQDHLAGVTVSVVQNGQVILKRGYGFASLNPRRPVDPDRTLFRVGSISKTFTWIAVMKEVEAGRMRLGQPVNLYLPEKVQVRNQGYDQPIRIDHLMAHSGGFEDRALGQLMERDYGRVRPLDLYLRQERPRRVFAPGAVTNYSNYGAGLAGQAVAYSSGKPFEQLVEDQIFRPLGLSSTTFREPHAAKQGLPAPMSPTLAARVADGYRWTGTGFERRDFEYIGQVAPAGSASSTAADMARYMLLQLGGGQLDGVTVYSPATARAFRTQLKPTPKGINGWAHGFAVYDLPGGWRGYGHEGATLSFNSAMTVVPQLGLGVFVASNSETSHALVSGLAPKLVRAFYAPPQPYPQPGAPSFDNAPFVSDYLSSRRAFSGLESFIGLISAAVSVTPAPGGRLAVVSRSDAKTWAPESEAAQGRFISLDGTDRLVFDMKDGRAAGFRMADGGAYFTPTPPWKRPLALGIMAALAALAALATLAGIAARNRREQRENQIQTRASVLQNIQALLWLAAIILFGVWAARSGDVTKVMYGWPGPLVITASACALVAALLTIVTLIAVPAIWRGGRRVDSWSGGRKAAFTLTVLIYTAFSLQLALAGALLPWSG